MKRILTLFIIVSCLAVPARGMDLTAPPVPDSAGEYMPKDPQNLSEGIREVLRIASGKIRPDLREAAGICAGMVSTVVLLSLLRPMGDKTGRIMELAGALSLSVMMLNSAGSMVNLASETVREISEYGKLLLPVMTSALAAQGGITASASIYTGTALFDAVLSSLISNLLTPMIYVYLALSAVGCAIGEEMLKKSRDAVKGLMTWLLKTILYIFTGYIGITGVISGTTDAAALKAAKLTISGVVPVVGGILSDASEAVLVSAGAIKNAAGLYGLFAVMAIWIGPFLKIGIHYLMLRLAGILCSTFGIKSLSDLIQDFASAMGMMLGMTGAVCLMFLISLICFMRGIG